MRICESSTMRSRGRQRGRPERSVSVGIVGEDGADSGEDGVVIVAELLHVGARARAGDPAAIVVGRGDLAVERDGGFQGDQRAAGAHEVEERLVQFFGFGGEFRGHLDFDAGSRSSRNPAAGHARIGVGDGRHHTRHAGVNQRAGARRRAAVVRAGFQIDVESGAACAIASLLPAQ